MASKAPDTFAPSRHQKRLLFGVFFRYNHTDANGNTMRNPELRTGFKRVAEGMAEIEQ
jgi:hypothetical protein